MNYRHAYHAGNFADVFKHVLLIALIQSFQRKDTPFCYLDTHAGIGCYDLHSAETQMSKEYKNGIEKILTQKNKPELIDCYIQCVRAMNVSDAADEVRYYPGSPHIAKYFLRPQDRMVLCELHPEEYRYTKKNFDADKQVAVHPMDGYQGLKALLPPKEKRGLVLIDPPYEKTTEFSDILSALNNALKRFETGVYAIWYPIKDKSSVLYFQRLLKKTISLPLLACELTLYSVSLPTHLNGCGMIVVNPPYQLDNRLSEVIPWLWKALSLHQEGDHSLKFL